MRVLSLFLPLFLWSGCVPYPVWDTAETDMTIPYGFSGFSWVVEGQLAGMPYPSHSELSWASEAGIDLLVSLTESGIDPIAAEAVGIEVLHIPVQDMTAPALHQLHTFVTTAGPRMGERQAIGVHCYAGMGRTGTFLAAWFVWEGMSADEAIVHVRGLRPGSIETDEQEAVIHHFAASLED